MKEAFKHTIGIVNLIYLFNGKWSLTWKDRIAVLQDLTPRLVLLILALGKSECLGQVRMSERIFLSHQHKEVKSQNTDVVEGVTLP